MICFAVGIGVAFVTSVLAAAFQLYIAEESERLADKFMYLVLARSSPGEEQQQHEIAAKERETLASRADAYSRRLSYAALFALILSYMSFLAGVFSFAAKI
jgi:hypothetical protein